MLFAKIQSEIEDYIDFLYEVGLNERFVKNRARVIADAKFTKATVQNIMNSKDEESGPSQEELDELDDLD